ncbi:MAG: ABC transporter permease [Acidobacteria bacterium]|nr:ABC transporter permease [Acidobacteriota bacterium]
MTFRDRASGWLFELALLAYPRAFRRRFGAEMRADFWRSRLTNRDLTPDLLTFLLTGIAERSSAVRRWFARPAPRPNLYEPTGRHAMFWETLRTDMRHALRLAGRTPLFTTLTVLALALGIGATSAIFAVVNGVLLRSLPYRDPGTLVNVWSHVTQEGRPRNPLSPANFVDFRRLNTTLDGLEGYFSFVTPLELSTEAGSEVTFSVQVTSGLFQLLGRPALIGRTFSNDDQRREVLLSHGYWQRRFGGDPAIVGKTLELSGFAMEVVGVMPPDMVFPYGGMLGASGFTRVTRVDVWVPIAFSGPAARVNRMLTDSGDLVRNVHWWGAVGRLKPGVTMAAAQADLETISAQLAQSYPDSNKGWSATVVPTLDQTVGTIRPALLLLMAGIGCVLLMAAVNVANLLLARAMARERELATRAALGAPRRRIMRQLLTESVLLSAAGGLAGLAVMWAVIRALLAVAPAHLPRVDEVTVDWRVLAVTALVTLVTGVLVGLAPALSSSHINPQAALQDNSRGAVGSGTRRRVRSALVVAEVALAVALTTGAGLLLRSFVALVSVNPGFETSHLLTWQMNLPDRLQSPDERLAFYRDFFARMEALPGVSAAGGTTRIPLGSTSVSTSVRIDGRPVDPADLPEVQFRRAMHNYFPAMSIPVIRGRAFTAEDGPTAPPVAVINETMARRLFPEEDAIGQRIGIGPNAAGPWTTIVGIIGDVRHGGLEETPQPEMYINYLQGPPVSPFIVLRTTGDPATLAETVRAEARAIDKDLPVYDLKPMTTIRAESVAERRFVLLIVSAFGVLALALAAIGVYGVMSLIVSERTREVAVRMALGAEPARMVGLIVGQAAMMAAAGVVVGLAVIVPLAPLMRSQLFGVEASDPLTLVAVPATLLIVAALAALVPARRAATADPLVALRAE